jgi:RNA polymerase sigma-70 factor (ECF subfamily)
MRRIEWGQVNEETLVLAAQDGDLDAFDELAKRYRTAARIVADRLVDREMAEDVVQDAFLAAYKALPQLKDRRRFGAWFLAIVRHRASRALAGNGRSPEPLTEHLDRLIIAAAPSIAQGSYGENAVATKALLDLPTDLRDVADLFYLQDWPVSRIASALGLTSATVKWRLHTARQKLRRALGPCMEQ